LRYLFLIEAPRIRAMRKFAASLVLLLYPGLAAAQPGPAAEPPVTVEIREWAVPWKDSRPRDPDVAPNGSVWLVGQGEDYVAQLDPGTGQFRRIDLPPGTGPHNLIVDRDAYLWIAGNRMAYIGRMNPNNGDLNRFTMPDERIRDPHTLVFASNNRIWFTAQWSNAIGRLNKRSGAVETIELPVERARPYGIRLDSAGRPWISLLGLNALATVDPVTLEVSVIRIPRADARPRRIAITSDDRVWYTDYAQGWLGVYAPATGEFHEYHTPSEQSGPYAIAADGEDRVWLVETWPQPNRLVGFDPWTEAFFSVTEIPSGGGAVRHMVFDPRSNSLWFGTDANTLGQALLPPPGVPVRPVPEPVTDTGQ